MSPDLSCFGLSFFCVAPEGSIVLTCQQGNVQVDVWSTQYGWGLLVHWNPSMIDIHNIVLLCNQLHLPMDSMHPNNNRLFQQDRMMCHQAHVAQNLFERHSENLWWMAQPPCSPNMGPFEHLCGKVSLHAKSQSPQISGSCGQLLRRYGLTYLQRFSDHSWK